MNREEADLEERRNECSKTRFMTAFELTFTFFAQVKFASDIRASHSRQGAITAILNDMWKEGMSYE